VPIQIICPTCGKSLKAPDSMAGKVAKCPSCGNQMTVPEAEPEVHEAEPVAGSELNPYNMSGLLDEAADDDYRLSSKPSAPSSTGEARRPCPACGEMIVVGAAKCRFCGEVFDQTLRRRTADPEELKKFRGEARGVGCFWIFIGTLVVIAGLGLMAGGAQNVGLPPGIGLLLMGLGAVWLILGVFACLKQLWALYVGLVLSYLSLAGNVLSLVQGEAGPQTFIGIGLLLIVIATAHRAIKRAGKLRAAGIPLSSSP